MPSARTQDPNGFLLVKGCPISSFGIFQYSAAQVGMTEGDPNRVVNVFRPESAVNDPELIASLQNVPVINDHEMLSGFEGDDSATAPEEYGVDGVLFDVAYQQPWLRGNVKVFSRSMQSDLSEGKADLSLGYTCDFLAQPGTFNGVSYDVVQTNMRGNHIALVSAGRVPGARVLDHKKLCFDHFDLSTMKERHMPKRKALDSDVVANLRAQLQALLPAFEQFLNEEAVEPAHSGAVPGAAEAPPAVAAAPAAAAPPPEPTDVAPPVAAAAPAAPAAAAPAAPAAGDPAQLLAQLEAICEQLRAVIGGGGEAAPPAEGGGEAPPNAEGGEAPPAEGGGEAPPASTEEPKGDTMPPEEKKPEGDAVEGLNQDPNSEQLAVDGEGAPEGNGTASPGPAAGKHTGADAKLIRAVHADVAARTRLYDRLSKVVGAFDGAMDITASTTAEVAAYGVKKLKLTVKPGQEVVALDAYLSGVEATRRAASATSAAKVTADAAASEVPAISAYFKE